MTAPTILFLGANGRDTTRLRLGTEARDIRCELENAGAAEAFRVVTELAVRPTDLQRLLLLHEPELIHFSGHGMNPTGERPTVLSGEASREFASAENEHPKNGFDGGLLLEDDAGSAIAVRPDVFAELLAIVKRDVPLRCVVLNACFTAAQAEAIAEHVDCVIGTARAIDDNAAIAFAIAFYRAIAQGKSVGTAFDLGRNEIGLRGLRGQDIPKLFVRPGVKSENVFLGDVAKAKTRVTQFPPAQDSKRFEPHWAHVLEPAQHFQGRERLREEIGAWLNHENDTTRIVAVCAIGGTGKTALMDWVLRDWLGTTAKTGKTLAGGVFVWSFYENDRVDDFFGEACRYFVGEEGEIGGRSGRLAAALKDGLPHLFVLDGLETVQAEQGTGRAKGEILDAAFRTLIRQIAAKQLGQTRLLVTSRFPLCDVESWEGRGYRKVDLDDLDQPAARAILRAWGVRGDDGVLDALAQRVGWHALSVRVMGAYLKHYADGNAVEGLSLDLGEMAKDAAEADRKAVKLDKLLGYVSMRMGPEEREVMARLSIFPRGIGADLLYALVESGGEVAGVLAGSTEKRIVLILRRLVLQGLAFSYGPTNNCVYTAHPFLRDHFKKLIGVKTEELHEVLRQKLAPSLQLQPGELPRDKETLDKYEALIEHTRLAGKVEEAFYLYWHEMGHATHLADIGDCWRGKRIVETFLQDASPEQVIVSLRPRSCNLLIEDLGFYANYFGDLGLAKRCYERSHIHKVQVGSSSSAIPLCNLASIEWSRGKFPAMARYAAEAKLLMAGSHSIEDKVVVEVYLSIAAFHVGNVNSAWHVIRDARQIRPRRWYSLMDEMEIDFFLRLGGRVTALTRSRQNLELCLMMKSLQSNSARFHILVGRAIVVEDSAEASRQLSLARTWTLRTGNMDVTLGAHRLAAEIELHENHPDLAHAEASEGLLLADSHGYGLYAIDLLLLLSRSCLALNRPVESFRHAKQALDRSTDPECGYVWGEADALHLLGLAHLHLGERDNARERFEQAAAIRTRIEHPEAAASHAQALALTND